MRANVEQAVSDFGIEYPVAQDNQLNTWQAYRNRSWPGKFLVDGNGVIRYQHFGEGQYAETERWIRELLAETGVSLDNVPANPAADGPVYPGLQSSSSIDEAVTRELFASSIKNRSAFETEVRSSRTSEIPNTLPSRQGSRPTPTRATIKTITFTCKGSGRADGRV